MCTPRLVVLKVHSPHFRGQPIPQKKNHHDHVGLLNDFRPAYALTTKEHIDRRGARLQRGEIDFLQLKIASELLEKAGALVEASVEIGGNSQPAGGLLPFKAEPE